MKNGLLAALLLAAQALLTHAPANAATPACDRACLEGRVADYVAALDAREPSRLALAPTLRFTENTVALALGDGFWQTIDKGSVSTRYRLVISDPSSSQAVFYGAATENGHGVLVAARLKYAGARLTEVEQFVSRRGPGMLGTFDDPPPLGADWAATVPPAVRASRAQLERIANLYFDGIERGDGDIVPVRDDCTRIENAFETAPLPARDGKPPQNIRESFSSKRFNYIREIRPRRILLVDEERGIVLGQFMFQHPGNIYAAAFKEQYKDPNSVIVYPNSIGVFEAFKVSDGKIAHIAAHMVALPYRQPPGWPVR